MAHLLELFPFLAKAKVLRQWAGIADMTPGLQPGHGPHAGARLLHRRRLGHVGL